MNVVRISDGLGNQMFQYAFARKLQLAGKGKVYLDTRFINHEDNFSMEKSDSFHERCGYRKYGLNNFRISLSEANEKILMRWNFVSRNTFKKEFIYYLAKLHLWPWQYWDESENIKKILFGLKNNTCSCYYTGYFFSLDYFKDIRHILQKEFKVKTAIRIPVLLSRILKTNNTVGIHIRKGDFTKLSRDISETSYYIKALKKMEEYIVNPIYLIFSDDIDWVKNNLEIRGEKEYVSDMGFTDYEELTIMKHCKNNIIANSTFSYWAAYLNENPNKVVICPKRWKPNIIPKEWIAI